MSTSEGTQVRVEILEQFEEPWEDESALQRIANYLGWEAWGGSSDKSIVSSRVEFPKLELRFSRESTLLCIAQLGDPHSHGAMGFLAIPTTIESKRFRRTRGGREEIVKSVEIFNGFNGWVQLSDEAPDFFVFGSVPEGEHSDSDHS